MKQKKMLTLTFSQLKQIYNQEIPEVDRICQYRQYGCFMNF